MPKKSYRPIPLEEFIASLPKAERDAIDRRTRELMAEELALQSADADATQSARGGKGD